MLDRKVIINDTVYQVIDECRKEVAVFMIFEYDDLNRQKLVWTDKYEEFVED